MIRFVWQSYVTFCALVHISIMPDAFSDFWILLQYLFGCLQCYINTGCPSLFSYRSVWNLIFISVTNPRQDHLSSPVKKGPCILIINLYLQTKSHFVYKKQTKIFSGNKTKRTSESKHFRKAENIFKCCDKADHTVASPPHILRNSSCYHPHLFEGLKAVRFLTLLWSPSGAENKCFRICVSIFTSAVIHACRDESRDVLMSRNNVSLSSSTHHIRWRRNSVSCPSDWVCQLQRERSGSSTAWKEQRTEFQYAKWKYANDTVRFAMSIKYRDWEAQAAISPDELQSWTRLCRSEQELRSRDTHTVRLQAAGKMNEHKLC